MSDTRCSGPPARSPSGWKLSSTIATTTRRPTQKAGAWRWRRPRPEWIEQLVLAADQFIVARPLMDDTGGQSIIAGYPWFADWGRDTMIALPGLLLTTGRHEIARRILTTFARFVDRGMLPNRFPDAGEAPEYNTVDAALWYFEAIRQYEEATGDVQLVTDIVPILVVFL